MSFAIDVDSIVGTLWDTLRPERAGYGVTHDPVNGGVIEEGLVFTLDLRLFHFSLGCDEYRRSKLVHIAMTGNTSVFIASNDEFLRWEQTPLDLWYNSSNHDSCWRSDGFAPLHQTMHDMVEGMNAEMQKDGIGPLAPREFSQFCTLASLGSKPWEAVRIGHRKIPTEYHKREILSIERAS